MRLTYQDTDDIINYIINHFEPDKSIYEIQKYDKYGNIHRFEVDIKDWLLRDEIKSLKQEFLSKDFANEMTKASLLDNEELKMKLRKSGCKI